MPFSDAIRIGAAGASTGYEVERSLRYNRSDNPNLSKAFSSAGNRQKWTWSCWIKFTDPNESNGQQIFSFMQTHANNRESFYRGSSGVINYQLRVGGSRKAFVTTNAQLRDPSAWYHLVLAIDSNQGSSSNRVKIYINGVLQTDVVYHDTPSSGFNTYINSTSTTYIGSESNGIDMNAYLAECHFIDGQQYDATYFGETNATTGQWNPKEYSGSYTGNSFYLNFSDNSDTTATTLGKDSSGLGNNWTPSGFSVAAGDGNDSVTDTPTLNKATLNPITGFTYNATLKNGNLEMTGSGGFKEISTIAVAGTSKFYYEVVRTISAGWQILGVFVGQPNNPSHQLNHTQIYGYSSTGNRYEGGGGAISGSPSWSTDDVVGLKYNNGTLQIYVNGTLYATSITGIPTTDIVFAYIANDNTNAAAFARFNSDSWTQDSAAGVDATWELSTANLPDPTIKLPNKHFGTILYTGDNTDDRDITDSSAIDFTPDLVWHKARNATNYNFLFDSVRGATKILVSNTTDTESTQADSLSAFITNGFTVSDNTAQADMNSSSHTYVAWNWKGGGSASSNGDGDITSQVSANTTAGFSIVGYTGNGTSNSDVTIGHGLGVTPDVVIIKKRGSGGSEAQWGVLHKDLSSGKNIFMQTTSAESTYTNQIKSMQSTTFTINVATASAGRYNRSGETYIAYCFSGVEGYSKFGSYIGNGNADGTFVHTGFKPAWIMMKEISSTSRWSIYDNKRDTQNPNEIYLRAQASNADTTSVNNDVDFLSNGFKMRGTGEPNASQTYIYLAFAESPFKNARAR